MGELPRQTAQRNSAPDERKLDLSRERCRVHSITQLLRSQFCHVECLMVGPLCFGRPITNLIQKTVNI